ncbi:hypothetical protein [Arthrobacter crystallopoietes]|uniref:Repeat domain-containing protein n=1 Tax=Crystallibacter crystallopoietes TaxID=37928 RepID=A0A1H0ZKB8_9MICC|nr:hypothetical protein [Arthrobacter crystallopoietes]SDQ27526.1 hypothetical protein SAMN04489742_0398 [Arthrobacter crystallopoietes]
MKERLAALAAAGMLTAGFIIPGATPAYAGEQVTGLSTTDTTSVATDNAPGGSAPASVLATPDPAPSGAADAAAEPVVKLEILTREPGDPELKFEGQATNAAGKAIELQVLWDGEWAKLWTSEALKTGDEAFQRTFKFTEAAELRFRAAVEGGTAVSEIVEAEWADEAASTKPAPEATGSATGQPAKEAPLTEVPEADESAPATDAATPAPATDVPEAETPAPAPTTEAPATESPEKEAPAEEAPKSTPTTDAPAPAPSPTTTTEAPVTVKATPQPVVNSVLPTISGSAVLGQTLTATPGTWTTGATFAYQWLREGQPITGATAATYKVTTADAGKRLSVRVTGTKSGMTATSATSALTAKVILGTVANSVAATISGSALVGSTLTAKGTWTTGATLTYQWLRDGRNITGATAATYKVTTTDAGTKLSVRITGSKTNYKSRTVTTAQTAIVAYAPAPGTLTYRNYTAPNGLTSQYHVLGNNVDTSQPVGIVFVFHGDYSYPAQSYVHQPTGSIMKGMAAEAAKKNMIMVPVITPDKVGGITWWEDIDRNGDYFRSLATMLIAKYDVDPSRVWFHGYSGGAEFTSMEVLSDRQNWIKGGGATIVGGGGYRSMPTAPSTEVKNMNLNWIAGSLDGMGGTTLATWSALGTAQRAEQIYSDKGFTKTTMTVLPGVNHWSYDMPALLARDLRVLPDRLPAANKTAKILPGDIAAVAGDGSLYSYPSAKGGDLATRTFVSAGWQNALNVDVADWNNDGVQDLVANWKNGQLTVDYGRATGGFQRAVIGSGGWQGYDVLVTKWRNADKFPGVIAKNLRDGKLYAYTNPTGENHGPRTLIGSSGWRNLGLMAMDYDQDAKMDLVVKMTTGKLKLYRSNGAGRFISEERRVVGRSGWNAMGHLSAIPNHVADGGMGILARDMNGTLYHYAVTKNRINKRIIIGQGGWATLRLGS